MQSRNTTLFPTDIHTIFTIQHYFWFGDECWVVTNLLCMCVPERRGIAHHIAITQRKTHSLPWRLGVLYFQRILQSIKVSGWLQHLEIQQRQQLVHSVYVNSFPHFPLGGLTRNKIKQSCWSSDSKVSMTDDVQSLYSTNNGLLKQVMVQDWGKHHHNMQSKIVSHDQSMSHWRKSFQPKVYH